MRKELGAVILLLLLALQPLGPLSENIINSPIMNVQVDQKDTAAPLDILKSLGIKPSSDLAHGWGQLTPQETPVNLIHRSAAPVSMSEWTSVTGDSTIDGVAILQHSWPVPTSWFDELEDAGISCFSFLPPSSFHCEVPNKTPAQLSELGVQAGMYLDPTDKIRPSLAFSLSGINTSFYAKADLATMQVVLSGTTLPDIPGIIIHSHNGRFATITTDSRGLAALSETDEIEWLEEKLLYQLFNDEADSVIKSDWVSSSVNMQGLDATWSGLDGTGIVVTVGDSGIDNGVNNTNMHGDFRDHILDILSWPIPQSGQGSCGGNGGVFDDGASDGNGHGTHVAGSVLGDGTQSAGAIKGSAPEAQLLFHSVGQDCNGGGTLMGIPDDFGDMIDLAAANGSLVHTDSWGVSTVTYPSMAGAYGVGSMQADSAAITHPLLTVIFSAGNDAVDGNNDGEVDLGALGPSGTAKNVLTVGASENNRPSITSTWGTMWPSDFPTNPVNSDRAADNIDGMAAFSSRGPVDDGRVKPDIVAPGTYIMSTKSSQAGACGWGSHASNPEYCYMGGTSMATPLTAGSVALLLQHLMDNVGHQNPSSALVKAILAANANDMAGQYGSATNGAGEAAPNNHEGWGLLDLQSSMSTSFIDGEGVATGDERKFSFIVPAAAPDLQFMLSWTDPASTTVASTNLVNDVDFELKDPSGTIITISNNLDNLVGHTISSPAAGTWEVHISGTNIPTGPQLFAFALSENYTLVNLTQDADFDGIEDSLDDCPAVAGTSTVDRMGCPDTDLDGYSDADGIWLAHPTGLADAFPNEITQWMDTDSDGFGDNPSPAVDWDDCPSDAGDSTIDRQACPDTDTDGYSDPDMGWTTVDGADACDAIAGTSTQDRSGCLDTDSDGYSDADGGWFAHPVGAADAFPSDSTQWEDTDSDTYGDNPPPANNGDDCPAIAGTSTLDRIGCIDGDSDGYSDADGGWFAHPIGTADAFPAEPTQWEDTDGDGYGDNSAGVDPDACPTEAGSSSSPGSLGCPDSDGDGFPDNEDEFPNIPSQWADADGDGYGDNPAGEDADDCPAEYGDSYLNGTFGCADRDKDGWSDDEDAFPDELTQWLDSDDDGYGDNTAGNQSDECPGVTGNSTEDQLGCPDSDGDGWSDIGDDFDTEPEQWKDSDGDGRGDNPAPAILWDDCPLVAGDSTIDRFGCIDEDGDGYSNPDDSWGWSSGADAFPLDPLRWVDDDQDGFDDILEDECDTMAGNSTIDRVGCIDSDGDGYSDPQSSWNISQGADAFIYEPSQWNDTDADGYGDNQTGFEGDMCIHASGNSSIDRIGCPDADGDGWSDADANNSAHPTGSADAFPLEPTQWEDADNDGYGDNQNGSTADDCPLAAGNSTSIQLGCPDSDGDGTPDPGVGFTVEDGADKWELDSSQWADTDGDGYGDNVSGTDGDHCPTVSGNSIGGDFFGCPDNDGDSWGDDFDAFPSEPSQWLDTDGDGYGDNNSRGAFLIDHWPSDADKNIAETGFSCSPNSVQTSTISQTEVEISCTLNNELAVDMVAIVQWLVPYEIDYTISKRGFDLSASGTSGDSAEMTFTARIRTPGTYETYIIVYEPGSKDVMSNETITIIVESSEEQIIEENNTQPVEEYGDFRDDLPIDLANSATLLGGLGIISLLIIALIFAILKRRKDEFEWMQTCARKY
ncbi:MAG: S8 family serine peptidase [Euryarchaeota archaeon]|nr:S8 family serine peptidase [Euryarchaeota archaeon]